MDKLGYFANEAFKKDLLLQEINKIVIETLNLNNENNCKEALEEILIKTMGFSNENIQELKELL